MQNQAAVRANQLSAGFKKHLLDQNSAKGDTQDQIAVDNMPVVGRKSASTVRSCKSRG